MVTLANGGAWLVNGAEIIADGPKAQAELAAKTGRTVSKEEAKKQTIAYGILENHNTSCLLYTSENEQPAQQAIKRVSAGS